MPTRHQEPGLLTLSTETGASETWPTLLSTATTKIDKYKPLGHTLEDILVPSLKAFLAWLPPGGRELIARDIEQTTTDQELYDVFHNLLTGLAVPSKLGKIF